MATRAFNFVEGEGIGIQAGPNPGDPDVLDVEISNTAIPDTTPVPAIPVSWSVLTDGNLTTPQLVFAAGDVIMVTS